jgi:hypothetical protein
VEKIVIFFLQKGKNTREQAEAKEIEKIRKKRRVK